MTANRLLVIDVVGLTMDLLPHAPRLAALGRDGFVAPMDGVFPAVTCTAQASMLTGSLPRTHGIVANGWYFRDLAEIWLWRQSNRLVQGSRLLDELAAEEPPRSTAKMFWWYNMHSAATWSVTPRPEYPADGRKIPGVYSQPAALGAELQRKLGRFPLFEFWGPTAGIASSRWIVDATLEVMEQQKPALTLAYLPHLDYDLQRWGPEDPRIPAQVAAIDTEVGRLLDAAHAKGTQVFVVSEYGIVGVKGSVDINRVLRRGGWLEVQKTSHGELLDAGASRAFAVADHQVAHVYVRDPEDVIPVRRELEACEGIENVLGEAEKPEWGMDHARSGELIAVSEKDRFFAYHYWLDEGRAPDFAPTVDIHRKPGYDPSELFFDPDQRLLKPRLAWMLLRKKLGFRTLMTAISQRPDLARGSHGRLPERPEEGPVFLSSTKVGQADRVAMTSVKGRIREALGLAPDPLT